MNTSPLRTALFNPINLAMIGLIVFAGLCAAWWMAPLGVLLWVCMVIIIARDRGVNISLTRQNRQPISQRYESRFDRLDRARVSIYNSLEHAGVAEQREIEPIQSALDELVECAYQLCLRMTVLDNNFAVQRLTTNFEADIEKIQTNIREATNVSAKNEYEATLKTLQIQREKMKQIAVLLERFEAQLTGINTEVDGVITGVLSLKGRSVKLIAEKRDSFVQIIKKEYDELRQFDNELQNTAF